MRSTSPNDYSKSWQDFEERFCISKWIELLLRFLDRSFLLALWTSLPAVALLIPCLNLSAATVVCFLIVFSFLSVFAHTVRTALSSVCEYPYWRSTELKKRDRQVISALFLVCCTLCILPSFLFSNVYLTLYLFLYIIIFDCIAARLTSAYVEKEFRAFLTALAPIKNKPGGIQETTSASAAAIIEEKKEALDNVKMVDAISFDGSLFETDDTADEFTLATQKRVRTKDGMIEISGQEYVEIEPDLESAVVWISFCPSFEQAPKFDFDQIGDDDIQVNVAFVQPFGARLEVRRGPGSNLKQNAVVAIEYFVTPEKE